MEYEASDLIIYDQQVQKAGIHTVHTREWVKYALVL